MDDLLAEFPTGTRESLGVADGIRRLERDLTIVLDAERVAALGNAAGTRDREETA